jgi:hypothetical protein
MGLMLKLSDETIVASVAPGTEDHTWTLPGSVLDPGCRGPTAISSTTRFPDSLDNASFQCAETDASIVCT